MADGHWSRYTRDLDGAWHAIDDLRDVLGLPRGYGQLVDRMASLERTVADMHIADEVTDRVRAELRSHRSFGLTVLQKTAAGLFAAVMMAGSLYSLIHAIGGH